MKKIILNIFVITICNLVFSQTDSLKTNLNFGKIDLSNQFPSKTKYSFTNVSKKVSIDSLKKNFKKYFDEYSNAIIFFFPSEDSLKNKSYRSQVKKLVESPKFQNAFIIGIPYITGVNDEGNVYFENHLVQDVECFIYTKNHKLISRTEKLKKEFQVKKVLQVSLNMFQISIKSDAVCVRENRIRFSGENFIFEFLTPTYNLEEKVDILTEKMKLVEEKSLKNEKEIEFQKKINATLKNQITDLEKSNSEIRAKLKLDKEKEKNKEK